MSREMFMYLFLSILYSATATGSTKPVQSTTAIKFRSSEFETSEEISRNLKEIEASQASIALLYSTL
jgi:hypothetical protein